jgi:hypothetical protein
MMWLCQVSDRARQTRITLVVITGSHDTLGRVLECRVGEII